MNVVALIPARSGSTRVPAKNILPLGGHPLIAYTIGAALDSGVFEDVVVSTDSEQIGEVARAYGAHVPSLRPPELASSESPDIAWVQHVMAGRGEDAFSILRPTSPFRTAETIKRAWRRFRELGSACDSLRAVEPVRQHPGKMWMLEGDLLRPLLQQGQGEVPYHSTQMAALPRVWVQNSSLEIAWSRVATGDKPSIAGERIAAFYTDGYEGFSIDYPEDVVLAEHLLAAGKAVLPPVHSRPT